jgi:hypothetical protein
MHKQLPALMPFVASVLPGAAPWLLQGQTAAGELIARPTAAAVAGLLGLSQYWVAGRPNPIALVKVSDGACECCFWKRGGGCLGCEFMLKQNTTQPT